MSSSPNSGKMHSSQLNETRTFEKYGVKFVYGVAIEKRQKWERMFRLKDGTLVPTENFDANKHKDQMPESGRLTIEWVAQDVLAEFEAVRYCHVQDDEYCTTAKPLELLITADGQMMGVVLDARGDEYVLLDPCLVTYDRRTNAIGYNPIFGVQRTLRLAKTAIRARMAPAELLISGYPGFMIQHRMYKYQLKPAEAFNQVTAADNDALPAQTPVR